jgi:hypothetical protein
MLQEGRCNQFPYQLVTETVPFFQPIQNPLQLPARRKLSALLGRFP